MRILHISSARAFGGGERHLADLACALAARGHDIYAAITPDSPLGDQLTTIPPQNIITLRLRNAFDVASAAALARFVRERKIEIIHAHMARDYPLAAFAARRARDSRLIITRHVLFPLSRLHAVILSGAARIIAVSESVARALRRQRLFPARKICVIPHGIDLDRFDLAARNVERDAYRRSLQLREPLLVGTLGELSEVKGQEDFVRAAAIVARRRRPGEVGFIIAGEDASRTGHYLARLENLIAALDLRDCIRLIGKRTDVAPFLSSLDVFVSPSRSEAFGLAIVEAMMCGAAVIATATDGAREIIDDPVTGRLVPVGDVEALAAAISDLLADASERGRTGARARADARARFNLGRMVEATERVYIETLNSR